MNNRIALYVGFVPRYCPDCGRETTLLQTRTLDEKGLGVPPRRADFDAGCTHYCPGCSLQYVRVEREHAITAAEASGTDLAKYI